MRVEGWSKIIASDLAGERARRRRVALAPAPPSSRAEASRMRAQRRRSNDRADRGNGAALRRASSCRRLRASVGLRGRRRPRRAAGRASSSSASLTISGGSRRSDVVAGGNGQQMLRARQRRRNRCGGTRSFRPSISPSPRTSAMTSGWRVRELGELCLAQRGPSRATSLEEARRQHDVEHRVADRHGQRIAAVGRAVDAGGHALARLRAVARQAPSGKPPPMPLASVMMSGATPASS